MRTTHRLEFRSATDLGSIDSASVELVVTSPPYPMIEMWDAVFSAQDATIGDALVREDGWTAFRAMHGALDGVWREVDRVLVDGGIACINVGDATRTIGGRFALYPNHAWILAAFLDLGFSPLPTILWRKQTNAPNKFMGSGMLPPGAYVTLEHEFVLIMRKGGRRAFSSVPDRTNRRQSAFFWEERNSWFSDVWFDLKGATQRLPDGDLREIRRRSGAFPLELPYRLVSMFSVKGDTVLDPFLGTGTTMFAAMATARNSVGFELDSSLARVIATGTDGLVDLANARHDDRLRSHADFITKRYELKGTFGYRNEHYGFPVVTRQETALLLDSLVSVQRHGETEFHADHSSTPRPEHVQDWEWFFRARELSDPGRRS